MGKNTLDPDGQERLKRVLEYAENDYFKIHKGIVLALQGVNEIGRRTYLWNQLQKRANRIINARLKKATKTPSPTDDKPLREMHGAYLDAFRHECRITAGISEKDW